MHSHAGTSESGVLYLVKDGKGKRFVRRPKPPPTSAPLAEDFDEATTRPPTEWNARTSWAPTIAPLPDDFDAMTYTAMTAAPMDHDGRESDVEDRNHQRPMESTRRSHSFASGPSRTSSSSRYRPFEVERLVQHDMDMELGSYGEYGEYTREMQQVFPSSKGFEVSISKTSSKHHARRSSDSAMTLNSMRRRPPNWKVRSVAERSGPRAGMEYDVVRDKILEEGPEKTVVISTWRERVADETKKEDMSVYYLSPRDYETQEEAFRASRDDTTTGSNRSFSVGQRGSPWPLSRETSSIRRLTSMQSMRTDERRSLSPVVKARMVSAPWTSTPKKQNDPARPRTLSPSPKIQPIRDNPRISRSHTPVWSSAPLRDISRSLTPPFIATRSGSTISSIKSRATTNFQEILASCHPPLTHISDALVRLGINSEGHLRAVARMSEDVRNREVKEEALKRGITVMEWALLLDKMKTL